MRAACEDPAVLARVAFIIRHRDDPPLLATGRPITSADRARTSDSTGDLGPEVEHAA